MQLLITGSVNLFIHKALSFNFILSAFLQDDFSGKSVILKTAGYNLKNCFLNLFFLSLFVQIIMKLTEP